MEPPAPRTAHLPTARRFIVQNEDGNDRAGRRSRYQRRIVGKAQILAEPDNDGHGAHTRLQGARITTSEGSARLKLQPRHVVRKPLLLRRPLLAQAVDCALVRFGLIFERAH